MKIILKRRSPFPSVIPQQLNIHFLHLRVGLQVVGHLVRGEDGYVIHRRAEAERIGRLLRVRQRKEEIYTQYHGYQSDTMTPFAATDQ